jgi:hypothetical protein
VRWTPESGNPDRGHIGKKIIRDSRDSLKHPSIFFLTISPVIPAKAGIQENGSLSWIPA